VAGSDGSSFCPERRSGVGQQAISLFSAF
jgi:hypothetical protein